MPFDPNKCFFCIHGLIHGQEVATYAPHTQLEEGSVGIVASSEVAEPIHYALFNTSLEKSQC